MRKGDMLGTFLFGAAALALAPAAHAEMITAKDPAKLAKVIEATDHEAKVVTDDGTTYIESQHNGLKFLVFFMNCQDDSQDCATIQYYMGYNDAKDTTLEQLNQWNREHRFARAYRDDEGDPVLEMDLDLDFKGLPRENVAESVETWVSLMDDYQGFLFGSSEE